VEFTSDCLIFSLPEFSKAASYFFAYEFFQHSLSTHRASFLSSQLFFLHSRFISMAIYFLNVYTMVQFLEDWQTIFSAFVNLH
jgi:hypothetical protein